MRAVHDTGKADIAARRAGGFRQAHVDVAAAGRHLRRDGTPAVARRGDRATRVPPACGQAVHQDFGAFRAPAAPVPKTGRTPENTGVVMGCPANLDCGAAGRPGDRHMPCQRSPGTRNSGSGSRNRPFRQDFRSSPRPRRRACGGGRRRARRLHSGPPGTITSAHSGGPAMNWITNYVRPKINSLFSRREVPENLWTKCPECGTMLFHRELAGNLNVCTTCDHHMAITPRDRFRALFDGGVFTEVKVPEPLADPLHFKDQKKYPERLKAARAATGDKEAMLVAEGEIARTPVVAAAQDFAFMAGSMGMYVGNALIAAAERAVALRRPLVVFSAAGGARMQEGILSLMQMPRTTVAVQMVQETGLPYIAVLTHPTTGGVTASYAMLGDVQIAEPNALICFAGPRVIEQTIREKLPEGFQRAEYLLDHGMLDRVTHRKAMRDELAGILRLLMKLPPPVKGDLPAPAPEPAASPAG
jgi:acetyl-CoA carboxylase carboxyl transferase subunit beta